MTEITVDATGDLSVSLRQASSRLGPGGGIVHVPAATYTIANGVPIPSGVTVDFQGSTVQMAYAGVFLKTVANTSKVRLTGSLTFVGNGSEFAGIAFNNSADIEVDLHAKVSGLGPRRPFLLFNSVQGAKAGSDLSSQDSRLIGATDSSNLEFYGVHAGPYQKDPGDGIVRALSTGAKGSPSQVYVHDMDIDGGGVLGTSGLISVSANKGTPDIMTVRIERCRVRNSTGPVDGVDVNRCQNVDISEIQGDSLNVAVAVIATNARVRSIQGHGCRAQAFAYGDPMWQSENISGLDAQDIEAVDCGQRFGSSQGAGIAVFSTPGTTSSNVVFRNIRSVDSGAGVQKFGLGLGKDVHGVRVTGAQLSGTQGKVANLAPPSELVME